MKHRNGGEEKRVEPLHLETDEIKHHVFRMFRPRLSSGFDTDNRSRAGQKAPPYETTRSTKAKLGERKVEEYRGTPERNRRRGKWGYW